MAETQTQPQKAPLLKGAPQCTVWQTRKLNRATVCVVKTLPPEDTGLTSENVE